MPSTRRRHPRSKSQHPTNKLLPPAGLLALLSCLATFAAGQRAPTPTPSPAASRFSGETPAPTGGGNGRGGGGGRAGGDDDDGDLSEVCEADGDSADYSEVLTGSGDSMARQVSTSTGCPNHVNWNIVPNEARVNPTNTTIPAYPVLIEAGGTTTLAESPGSVGILLNGVAVFSSWAAAEAAVSYETSAFFTEGGSFDACGGHATKVGIYHFHSTPGCLQEHAMVVKGSTRLEHSPQLGWAYDGFPIYGQLGPGGVEMKLCGQQGADGVHCLDLCSGYEAELPNVDGFKYRYYLSCGFDESFFPFVTNCYRGCCPAGMECSSHVEECTGTENEAGYAEGEYTPVASASLADPYDVDFLGGVDTEYVDGDVLLECSAFVGSESEGYSASNSSGITSTPTPAPTAMAANVATTSPVTAAVGSLSPYSSAVPDSSPVPPSSRDSSPAPSVPGAPAAAILIPATRSPEPGSTEAEAGAAAGAPPSAHSPSWYCMLSLATGGATVVGSTLLWF